MRKTVVAGNWKMNNDLKESEKLIVELKNLLQNEKPNCDVIVCPPYTSLSEASKLLKRSQIMPLHKCILILVITCGMQVCLYGVCPLS